jgi:hypothetical protein
VVAVCSLGGCVRPDAHRSDTFPALTLSKDSAGRIELGTRMGVLIDSSNTLTLEQALRADLPWNTIDRKSPNFGFTQDAYWFRFQINNVTDRALPRLIELPIPFLDDVRLYHLVDGLIMDSYSLGDELPFVQRTRCGTAISSCR